MTKLMEPWFDALLKPITGDEFWTEIFERRGLHLPQHPGRPIPELTPADLDHLVALDPTISVRAEEIRSGHAVGELAPGGGVSGSLEAGHTVRLLFIHKQVSAIQEWCTRLETLFQAKCSANVYGTPAKASGLSAHYDTHDVLVYQVNGTKHWSYGDPLGEDAFLPLRSETGQPIDMTKFAKRSLTLAPGDFLYLPRGVPHATLSGDAASIHITFGIEPLRWRDVLVDLLLGEVHDTPFFRRAVRPAEFARFGSELEALAGRMPETSRSSGPDRILANALSNLRGS